MRHAKKGYKLGRTASHRRATLSALSGALIRHKQITTTLAKAKALRLYIEPLITRAREDTTHNRREVFRHLMDKQAVTELFEEIAEKVGDRPGGYTRVLRLGQRSGDAAEMAIIELVDYNESEPTTRRSRRRRTRRGRRRRGPASLAADAPSTSSGSEEATPEASSEQNTEPTEPDIDEGAPQEESDPPAEKTPDSGS
ncbi:MAG: 50S ribosomal protein L17 [Bacteroidetes bacterium]|nr:50S ribosomal protein L17 [Bacteroidota bacterium]MDE2671266.1 50S ribosomal protein L17 [Bacteroidota bacterium]